MTKWQDFPLRQQGAPWPGLNTRGGRLDDGRGWLEDGSVNAIINRADVLQKRKGLVRGLDEAFDGVVCGLFPYTSNCGIEYLLVADQLSINIRQPFNIPTFTQSDAYPFDSFSVDGAPNSENWRNTSGYTQLEDQLRLVASTAAFTSTRLPAANFMRWFKDAANKSYQVRVQYSFDATVASVQHVAMVIKGQGDLTTGALLQADLIFNGGALEVEISHRRSDLTVRRLLLEPVTDTSGFFTLAYNATTRLISTTFGTTVISAPADSITVIDDADLGQISAIGMGFPAGLQPSPRILVVDGGPI
jgi:hypothetical protein